MKIKGLALIVLAIAFGFTSCKKDDDKKEETTTASIVGTWKLTAETVTVNIGGKDSTMDEYASLDPCEKDDLTRFNADNSLVSLAGATKCNPNDPGSEPSGNWALLSSNTKLRVIDSGDTTNADVLTLSNTTLKLKLTEDGGGFTFTILSTFTRQ
jgi:hypothetical protein